MSEKFIDNPTQIRKDEVLDNNSLCNYLINFLDIDKSNFELLQFPSGFSNLTYLIIQMTKSIYSENHLLVQKLSLVMI